jgi:RND family efflux transporter MFP subunit
MSLGLGGVAEGQEKKRPSGPPPALVVTAPVKKGAIKPEVSLVGTVRARARSVVAAEVAGLAREVKARRGKSVRKGDVLAVLRDAELDEELEAAGTEVRLAEAELEKARADLVRAEDLVNKGVSPIEQRDATKRDAQVWEQRLAKARSVVRGLEDRVSRQTVRAPFDGVVVEEHVEVGEWVLKGGPVAEVSDLTSVLVRVPVPEQYVVEISRGQKVPVHFDALPKSQFRGTVAAVIPMGDPQARTFPVEVGVPNPKRRISPGMSGRVAFPVGGSRTELLVPKDALVPRGGRTLVYAVVEGRAVEVPVEVVGYQKGSAAIERVRSGQPVRTAERK